MSGFSSTGSGVFVGSAAGSGGGGAVNTVENTDGTLIVSPTTGTVIASRPAITGDVSVPSGSNVAALEDTANVIAIIEENAGVQTVTPENATINVAGTAENPTITTGGLDTISGVVPAISAISGAGQQIKDIANGSQPTDAVALQQLIAGSSSFMQTMSGSQVLPTASWQTLLTTPTLAVGTWYLFGSVFANGGTTLGEVFWATLLAGTGATSSTLPGGIYYLPSGTTGDNGGSVAVAGIVVVTTQGTFTLSGATDSGGTVTARGGLAQSPPAGVGMGTYLGGYRLS